MPALSNFRGIRGRSPEQAARHRSLRTWTWGRLRDCARSESTNGTAWAGESHTTSVQKPRARESYLHTEGQGTHPLHTLLAAAAPQGGTCLETPKPLEGPGPLTCLLSVMALGWHLVQMPLGHGRCPSQPDLILQLMFSRATNFPLHRTATGEKSWRRTRGHARPTPPEPHRARGGQRCWKCAGGICHFNTAQPAQRPSCCPTGPDAQDHGAPSLSPGTDLHETPTTASRGITFGASGPAGVSIVAHQPHSAKSRVHAVCIPLPSGCPLKPSEAETPWPWACDEAIGLRLLTRKSTERVDRTGDYSWKSGTSRHLHPVLSKAPATRRQAGDGASLEF